MSEKTKTPGRGRGGCIILLALFVGGAVLGVVLKETTMPVIMLAAEDIPLPYSQIILGVGLVIMLFFAVRLFLLGHKWALLVVPAAIFVECLVYFTQPIPNTLPSTWLTLGLLFWLGTAYDRAQRKEGPPSRLRLAMEMLGEGLIAFFESAIGERAKLFFPLVATFFLFIVINNWCGILPGFGSVGVWVEHHGAEAAVEHHEEEAVVEEHGEEAATAGHEEEATAEHGEEHEAELVVLPFFRSANAHLSTTLALALISMTAVQYFGFKLQGSAYKDKYFNFKASSPKPDPNAKGMEGSIAKIGYSMEVGINGLVGLLEIPLEALKVLPFSFRLFGNIFAGEVLLFVVSYLFVFVFPILFLGLELFVGLIQGFIFAMLSLVFFSMAATSHHGDDSH